jgi:hypothetical protein
MISLDGRGGNAFSTNVSAAMAGLPMLLMMPLI